MPKQLTNKKQQLSFLTNYLSQSRTYFECALVLQEEKLNSINQIATETLSTEVTALNFCYKEQFHVLKEQVKETVK